MIVTVPSGAEVTMSVKAGEAETKAAEIRAADEDGSLAGKAIRSP
ncbi:hypothetical protein [Leifsonia xyli]|nr:hypothetical protein [Leifsonia xyli]